MDACYCSTSIAHIKRYVNRLWLVPTKTEKLTIDLNVAELEIPSETYRLDSERQYTRVFVG